jgi:hypothetical protein
VRRWGHVAEWLRAGLQNRLHQFDSGRGLQLNQILRDKSEGQIYSRQRFVSRRSMVESKGLLIEPVETEPGRW